MYDPAGKAELLASVFIYKNVFPEPVVNEYSQWEQSYCKQKSLHELIIDDAHKALADLDESSGTGPDLLLARTLKQCRHYLAYPILQLALSILDSGVWPAKWRIHCIVPIFKRGTVFLPKNYRGVHLTAQLSKVVERLLRSLMLPHITLWN